MMYLSEGLKINTSIQTLDLSENNLGGNEKSMMYLSEGLRINISIIELFLSENNLGRNKQGMVNLMKCLKSNSSIKELHLYNNNFRIAIIERLSTELVNINIYHEIVLNC